MTKWYGRRIQALSGLSVVIPRGSVTALVGPNGAGKSTVMKAWVGFERPSGGRVLVNDIDLWTGSGRRRALPHIGYVPQDVALYRDLTVEEHLTFVSTLRPAFDEAVAHDRLADLGIETNMLAGELSGGQRAQVSLALALASGGEILVLDEPLASLDPLARREFLHLLREQVQLGGRTAVLSSHVVTDIEETCDRLVVLAAGRNLLDATIADALAGHSIVDGSSTPSDATEVATFPGPMGQPLRLLRRTAPSQAGARPATLEEVVLGYLATTRTKRAASAAPPEPVA